MEKYASNFFGNEAKTNYEMVGTNFISYVKVPLTELSDMGQYVYIYKLNSEDFSITYDISSVIEKLDWK